jgi:hypothetical protein
MRQVLGIDVSHHSQEIEVHAWERARDEGGLEHAVVRLSTDASYNRLLAVRQLRSAVAAGLGTSGYVWCAWARDPESQMADVLALVDEADARLATAWLDVEEGLTAYQPGYIVSWLRRAAEYLASRRLRAGIYTSYGNWSKLGFPTDLRDLPLWNAQWDNQADLSTGYRYGGWEYPYAGKQYWHDVSWYSIWCDQNVFEDGVCTPLDTVAVPSEYEPIPREYQEKFNIGPYDTLGLISNFEGVIVTAREQAYQAGLAACHEKSTARNSP